MFSHISEIPTPPSEPVEAQGSDYSNSSLSLLAYLDNTDVVSFDEVCRLVAMVTDSSLEDLADTIVNNYHSKGLFFGNNFWSIIS